jgi:RNA polymerase sigma factor (sigma-70 family)
MPAALVGGKTEANRAINMGEGKPMVRSEAEVERLVSENQKLVQLVVSRYLKRYYVGTMEREDLISWGMIGLVQAALRWDPERGASFSTLACKAIERMIIPGVRREWKPDQASVTVSLDDLIADEAGSLPQAGGGGPQQRFVELIAAAQDVEGELLHGETCAAVRAAVAELAPAARLLIERHYYEAVPVARLAEELGLSRQGIYARQRLALRQLRAALSPTVTSGAP